MKTIIIAGPKSAGKTTLFNHLQSIFGSYPHIFFQPEINPYTFKGKNFAGGAFTDQQLQARIVKATLETAQQLVLSNHKIIFWETGLFNLAYVKYHSQKWYKDLKPQFIKLFTPLSPIIIFIQTPPSICWQRRKDNYLNRIQKYLKDQNITDPAQINSITNKRLQTYKTNLYQMHDHFNQVLDDQPFPTLIIDNRTQQQDFLTYATHQIQSILKL